ncbi:hypothetical protein IAQ61_001877 [Plenodomus lingam]|uniref:uncharacterized protein n=1 Tax=Leptosphaeria maculans TaxID=5022 RepID=UPI003316B5DC|nr:hypothetical protein IAQ61_001877 [Plenodomus lingam]
MAIAVRLLEDDAPDVIKNIRDSHEQHPLADHSGLKGETSRLGSHSGAMGVHSRSQDNRESTIVIHKRFISSWPILLQRLTPRMLRDFNEDTIVTRCAERAAARHPVPGVHVKVVRVQLLSRLHLVFIAQVPVRHRDSGDLNPV